MKPSFSYQLSVISYQLSVISYQLSIYFIKITLMSSTTYFEHELSQAFQPTPAKLLAETINVYAA